MGGRNEDQVLMVRRDLPERMERMTGEGGRFNR